MGKGAGRAFSTGKLPEVLKLRGYLNHKRKFHGFGVGWTRVRNEPRSVWSGDWVVVSGRTGLWWETIWMERKKKKIQSKRQGFKHT